MSVTSAELNSDKRIPAVETAVDELIKDCKVGNIKLNVFRGAKRLVMVFNETGDPCVETDPDDGTTSVVKMVSDNSWYLAEAAAAKLRSIPGAAHVMAWKWSAKDGAYIIDRTEYTDSGNKIGDAGVLNQIVTRHLLKGSVSALPGVAELGLFGKACAELGKKIKDDKGKVPTDLVPRMVSNLIAVLKAVNVEPHKFLAYLVQQWPELRNNPSETKSLADKK